MGINEVDKTPLETFWIHNLSNNEEFIKVVNRITDKYSEDELKDLKISFISPRMSRRRLSLRDSSRYIYEHKEYLE